MSKGPTIKAKYGMKKIRALQKMPVTLGVVAGVLRGTGEHPNGDNGQTIAEIAWWNEFGTDRGIPERPFLRTAIRRHMYYRKEVADATAYALRALAGGMHGFDIKLRLVGMRAARDIQDSLNTGGWKENAESTKRKKSRGLAVFEWQNDAWVDIGWLKAQPLVDTGVLRASISWGFADA